MYRQGPLGVLSMLLDVRTIDGFVAAMHAMTELSRHDSETIVQLKAAKAEAVTAHNALLVARKAADKQQRVMAANAATRKAQAVAEAKVLAGLNATVKRLIAEEKAREAAIAAAKARAALARERAALARRGSSHSVNLGGTLGSFGGNPPASGRGAKAVWWAERELGRPYRWGAAGPSSFDCSGLVMWAYRHVGVSLPHHAASQIGHGQRVSRSNLQPGDLVFFGYPIHHVGMYVGGGDFIEAPYTGCDIRISSLSGRGDFAGACRP
jgi:cell wall-associated NlpC family hydrolase